MCKFVRQSCVKFAFRILSDSIILNRSELFFITASSYKYELYSILLKMIPISCKQDQELEALFVAASFWGDGGHVLVFDGLFRW